MCTCSYYSGNWLTFKVAACTWSVVDAEMNGAGFVNNNGTERAKATTGLDSGLSETCANKQLQIYMLDKIWYFYMWLITL